MPGGTTSLQTKRKDSFYGMTGVSCGTTPHQTMREHPFHGMAGIQYAQLIELKEDIPRLRGVWELFKPIHVTVTNETILRYPVSTCP